jgi:hypothetical protein
MPEMCKALAEDERQVEIDHLVQDHVEQLQLFNDQVEACQA